MQSKVYSQLESIEEGVSGRLHVFINSSTRLFRYDPFGNTSMRDTIDRALRETSLGYISDKSNPGVQTLYPGENGVMHCAFFIHVFLEKYHRVLDGLTPVLTD
jgi:hypothetical protein